MRTSSLFRTLLPLAALLLLPSPAGAQQIKSRVMVLLDTSGSMGFHFLDPQNGSDYPGGDGSTSYTDINTANVFAYPGKLLANNTRDGVNSRLYAAKTALSNAISAYAGDVDFGLETYDFSLCGFNTPRCEQCVSGARGFNCLYTNNAFTQLTTINWQSLGCTPNGGRVVVLPGMGSGAQILPWIDGVEVHTNNGLGVPTNPEVRADGSTPLASAIAFAKTGWYDVVKATDPQVNCRPYVLVVETDGVDSCNGDTVAAAKLLHDANPLNPVLTYVIGLSITQADQANLNNTANAGGSGVARFANNETDIEAAYADILARSVRVELCNGADDNCNGLTDEGFDKGAACSAGLGVCARSGVKKCDPGDSSQTTCCVNDGMAQCVPLRPGAPQVEVCNGLDDNCNGLTDEGGVCIKCTPTAEVCDGKDNDCDGIIDNHLIDVGQPCGFNVGICKPGKTVCVNSNMQDVTQGAPADMGDSLVCLGGTPPRMEVCNGLDDNCDGIVDGISRVCYDGPGGTEGVGICVGGEQKCTAVMGSGVEMWGACVGEITPRKEICNGLDDDCNGKVDDVMGAGAACCPSGKCGIGICKAGTMQCSGGQLACVGGQGPQGEICNGLDDDCNGKVDDLPSLGKPCQPQGGCMGQLQCDIVKMQVVCGISGMTQLETCDGVDNNCNGLVDEEPDVSMNDARIGQPCGNNMMEPLPCLAGKTVCKMGMVVCQGAVGPKAELCNCIDDDCNGLTDDNAPCPPNTACYHPAGLPCGCYAACGLGEFKCPGGYECDAKNFCIPTQLCNPPCGDGFECKQGVCHDKCADLSCPDGYKCDKGMCVDTTCVGNPTQCKKCDGSSGQLCDPIHRMCTPDRCCGVSCPLNQFCDPNRGTCIGTCATVTCPDTQTCIEGNCAPPRCDPNKPCPEGKICNPRDGTCAPDACNGMRCVTGFVCVGGACVVNNCLTAKCPDGYKCSVSAIDGLISCDKPRVMITEQDRIVSNGGGGLALGCSISGAGGSRSTNPTALLLLLAMALVGLALRRRRA